MQKWKAIVVDDEELARKLLREMIAQHPEIEIAAECANGMDAVKAAAEHKPDLLFLDIQMPKLTGFDVLELIEREKIAVIFVTAYDQYAMKAFDVHAVDYLLKPERMEHVLGLATLKRLFESVSGPLAAQPFASQIYGLYTGLVYLTPILGGWLADHGLGRRRQRVGALAQVTAATSGLVVDDAKTGPFGFCHFAARPGDLVALDSFSIGNLKGVGKVWQLTAVDTATRWAVCHVFLGPSNTDIAKRFLDRVIVKLRKLGVQVSGVLTDNGPEFSAAFDAHLDKLEITHYRTPPRSPNHNAVCERFQGTALQECWRPAFHRRRFENLGQLRAEITTWLVDYNTRRPNHGDFMTGRTPRQVLDQHRTKHAS